MSARLDHGVLNLPLAKRGNIDAQIDAYKAEQRRIAAADRKAKAAEISALRIRAKAAAESADVEMLKRVAARTGVTLGAVKKALKSDAHWRPEFVIRALGGAA